MLYGDIGGTMDDSNLGKNQDGDVLGKDVAHDSSLEDLQPKSKRKKKKAVKDNSDEGSFSEEKNRRQEE